MIKQIPKDSIIHHDLIAYDYCDCFQVNKTIEKSVDEILTPLFTLPVWVDNLIRIRNSIVKIFGIKGGDPKNINKADYYHLDTKAMLFTVFKRNDYEIVMLQKDKHLNAIISVLTDKENSLLSFTTIVKYNNSFGRMYFNLIKPLVGVKKISTPIKQIGMYL